MSSESEQHPPRTLLIAAFAAVYIVWGSTYLAIRVAVETLPPFLMAGARFLLAGALLYVWLWFKKVPVGNKLQWRNAFISGCLLLLGGNGLVVWAEQTVTSSVTALIIATTPVWFAVFDWLRPGGKRPAGQTVIGILIGFIGVSLLIAGKQSPANNGNLSVMGMVALVSASMCWASGSLFTKYSAKTESPAMNITMQMLCGGAALMVVALLNGEFASVRVSEFSGRSLAAFFYLVVFGSWVGFGAYVWLLRVSTPSRVSTYAYVNPVIAVFLGWAILGEVLTERMMWAALVILLGVIIITLPTSATKHLTFSALTNRALKVIGLSRS